MRSLNSLVREHQTLSENIISYILHRKEVRKSKINSELKNQIQAMLTKVIKSKHENLKMVKNEIKKYNELNLNKIVNNFVYENYNF